MWLKGTEVYKEKKTWKVIRRSIGPPTGEDAQLWHNIRFNSSSFCSGLFARAGPSNRKLVSASIGDAFGRVEGAGMLELDHEHLKDRIRVRSLGVRVRCIHRRAESTLCKSFMRTNCARYCAISRCSYFGQNIAGRATSILCLYYLRVIKCPASRESSSLYLAHNCAIDVKI